MTMVLVAVCAFFLLIAAIDLRYKLVLNAMVFPAALIALVAHAIPPGRETLSSLLGGAFGFVLFAAAAWLKPGGMGGGDVKLAALVGLTVGFPLVLWALGLGIVVGGAVALGLLLARRQAQSTMPYAPFLCLGAIVALLYNPFPLFLSLFG